MLCGGRGAKALAGPYTRATLLRAYLPPLYCASDVPAHARSSAVNSAPRGARRGAALCARLILRPSASRSDQTQLAFGLSPERTPCHVTLFVEQGHGTFPPLQLPGSRYKAKKPSEVRKRGSRVTAFAQNLFGAPDLRRM